ncbi:MAG: alpha-hydroxy-acid oxidizing protein [Methylobacillus sp.]|jgi:4-hydroxymandelate oxidase|nr:alpha-hydroxy-acid oxidizing protein [Methylobacillus sp.]
MNELLPKLNTCPADVQCPQDYLTHAECRLDTAVWDYLQHGSGENITLIANRRAFDETVITPHPLADMHGGNTRIKLFDQEFAHPIALAPVAYQKLFHPDGERASAMAANAQGGWMMVSSLASQTLEEIARATDGPWWFQLYWQGDRTRTLRLLQRALMAGCSAVVFTIDAPIKHAIMQLPADVRAVNLEAPHIMQMPPNGSAVFDGWMAQAPHWEDVAWLRKRTSMSPLLLKGVLSADDAKRAIELGCDAVIVSNHGGRVLDGSPASLDVLPQILDVARDTPVLLDGGIRNGRDVFKALDAGAAAVAIGRPYIWGLATAGALGVAHVLRMMRDELEMTMALAGRAKL